jgi:hypothetical protein
MVPSARGAEYARAALSTCHAGSSACCPFRLFLPFRVWRLLVEPDTRYLGGSRVRRGRALSRGQATARPSPQAVSAHWVTIAPPRIRRQSKLPYADNQDWSHCRLCAAPWQPHQLISGRAPMARTKILHTRGSTAPRWMGLISRTADKANPASSVTHPSWLWPGSVGQTH